MRAAAALAFAVALRMRAAGRGGSEDEVEEVDEAEDEEEVVDAGWAVMRAGLWATASAVATAGRMEGMSWGCRLGAPLRRLLPGVVRSRRALTVSSVQSSCRRYQPRGVVRALPWRIAWRRSGSRMVAGVRGDCPGSWGGGLDGSLGSCASTSTYGWPWLGSAGLGGAGWLLG